MNDSDLTNNNGQSNQAVIRQILTESFTDEELRILCYDLSGFQSVYRQLSPQTNKSEVLRRLIDYASRNLLDKKLLDAAQKQLQSSYKVSVPFQNNITIVDSIGPLNNTQFFDGSGTLMRVVNDLEAKHQIRRSSSLPQGDLLSSLAILFDRKAFRRESLFHCTTQAWSARLHVAYQTLYILQAYQINVRDFGSSRQYELYRQLLGAVDHYCMMMATHLFEQEVSEEVKRYMGTPDFTDHLPKERKFIRRGDSLQDMDTSWDESRSEACTLMDDLVSTVL